MTTRREAPEIVTEGAVMIFWLFGLLGVVCLHFLAYGTVAMYVCLTEKEEA